MRSSCAPALTAEEMAAASLDQNFKEELSAIEQCAFLVFVVLTQGSAS